MTDFEIGSDVTSRLTLFLDSEVNNANSAAVPNLALGQWTETLLAVHSQGCLFTPIRKRQRVNNDDSANIVADTESLGDNLQTISLPVVELYGETSSLLATIKWSGVKLGSGGFGKVYKGELKIKDPATSEVQHFIVAIKIPSKDTSLTSLVRELEKFQLLGENRYIVGYHGICRPDPELNNGMFGLIMDFAKFGSLDNVVQRYSKSKSNVPWTLILSWLTQVNFALGHMHRLQQLHGDIKPANILLTANLEVRLTDFGTTRALDSRSQSSTPFYCAPERFIRGEQGTKASDVYSLAISGYHLLTSRQPSRDYGTVWQYYESLLNKLPDIVELDPLVKILITCSKQEPESRLTTNELEKEFVKLASSLNLEEFQIIKESFLSFLNGL
jgi:serine/threonine protein kinase